VTFNLKLIKLICKNTSTLPEYLQVCPRGIEEIILGHPAVSAACVIGINDPNGGGSIPKAFVVLKENLIDAEENIKAYANGTVMD